jgi:fructokinase
MSQSAMLKAGMDLGGTKIEGVVLAPDGRELFRQRVPSATGEGYEAVLRQMQLIYNQLQAFMSGAPHTLGICTPGSMSRKTGLMKNCNAVCLNGQPLFADLRRLFARDFAHENDSNCFAIAEATYGAGRGFRNVLGVIMGTGCGSGIVIDGKLLTGLHGIAGEIGHMSINPAGPQCYCGRRGCVERYISGSGLEARYLERSQQAREAAFIVAAAQQGEPLATEVMAAFYTHFGEALANVIAVLDPDVIVLGGGLSHIDGLYMHGVAEIARLIFNDSMDVAVLRNELGDASGVLGAAAMGI